MAKKIFDTQTGIPKQETLDMSMFDKKELDLSMFKKKEESVSPEPESQSSGANVDPQELRYTDYKLKLDNLSIDKPKPFGISDDMNINLMDIAAKAEASKPVKNQFSDYALGVPAELNDIVGNTFEWIGKRTQDLDQVLGGVPGYLISKFSPGNPEAQARASLQEQYLKEKDPQKKAALGEQINVFREEQNPFLQVSRIYKNAASNLPSLPENIAGQAIKGAVDAAPLILSLAYTPEITLPEILGTSFKIPKFTTLEAVKGFYKGATKEGSVQDKIKNSLVETAYGAGTGTFLHGLGVTSQQVGELVGKSGVLKGTTAALANGLGFSAYDAGSQFYQTGEVDLNQSIASGVTGAILGIPEVASIAYNKAASRYLSSPKSAIESVANMKIDPVKLREESNKLGEQSEVSTGEQRNDILANKNMIDSILDINAVHQDIVKNADVYHEMINKSDIPDARKKELNDKIDLSVEIDKRFQEETDSKVLGERENSEPKEPSLSISDDTRNVFRDIELGVDISNKRLTEASDNLIQEYTRLNAEKHSPDRQNTSTEINSVLDFLDRKMQDIEKEYDTQREKRIIGDFKGIKTESEVKVPPKENNAPTSLLDTKNNIELGVPVPSSKSLRAILHSGEESTTREITKDGKNFGEITTEPKPDGWEVKRVDINEEGKGYGKDVYRKMNALANESGTVIKSDAPNKINTKARGLWDSLVRSGEAKKMDDGSYRMLNKNIKENSGYFGFTSAEGNKVVDGIGNPIVLYHGSKSKFTEFDEGLIGKNDPGVYGRGIYFSENKSNAVKYGGGDYENVMPFYVNIKNPYILDFNKGTREGRKILSGKEIPEGYDGVIVYENGMMSEVVVKNKNQVKYIGDKTDAVNKQTTKPLPELEVRPQMGEETPLRQPNEKPTGEGKETNAPQEVPKVEYFPKEDKPSTSGFAFGDVAKVFRGRREKFKPVSIKNIWNKYMTATRGAPKEVHDAWKSTSGKIAARHYDIQNSVKDKLKEISSAYGRKLTDADMKDINTALEQMGPSKQSQDIFFNTISGKVPEAARPALESMRAQIDAYSNELMKLNFIGEGLEGRINENTGYYLTRSYKKHTDRRWTWDAVPTEIKEKAAEKVAELYPELTPDEVKGFVKSLVESKDVTSLVVKQGQSLADIDKASLKKRSVFLTDNPEIRELLGQNENPFYNYAVSLTRMAEMIERGRMLEGFVDSGSQNGWLSERQSFDKNHISKIPYNQDNYKGKAGTKQLSDYYTTPEIADAIGTYFKTSSVDSKVMRAYMKAITSVKLAKTAGSVKGTVRNLKSNITNAVANANWNVHEIIPYLHSQRKDFRAFVRELKEKSIIGDSSNAGELVRNLEDLSRKISEIEKSDETFTEAAKRNVVDKLIWTYSMADDVWKVWRYASEYTRYKNIYEKKGIQNPDAAAKDMARSILHDTSTYYSELPLFIQGFRKLPVAQTFISFPYLTTMNYLGTIKHAWRELRDPDMAHIGIQRMAGAVLGASTIALLAHYRNLEKGVDEKEMEAWRRFLPGFWKNDIISITKDHGDGRAEYNNTSYMDYYGALTTPIVILQRRLNANGKITSDDIQDAATDFAKNFVGWDILFDRITNLKANQDDTGRQIYNPAEDWDAQYKQMTQYLLATLEPGTLTDAKRIYRTYREGGEWQKQLQGTISGSQSRTIDPMKSWNYYMLPAYKDQMENARRIYTQELRKFNRLKSPGDVDKKMLSDAKSRAENAMNKILGEITKDYDAAITVGVSSKEVDDAVKSPKLRLDKDIRNAIFYRQPLMLLDDGQIVVKSSN